MESEIPASNDDAYQQNQNSTSAATAASTIGTTSQHHQQTGGQLPQQTPAKQSSDQLLSTSKQSSNQKKTQAREENTTVCLPIVYGSIAFYLPKTEEYNTHRWSLYVCGPNNEDLSRGIAKVVFHLHPSFVQPIRELTAPPFEVTEKGWGEFEASIRIVWRDPAEKALVLMHMIKLYPPIDKSVNVPGSGTGVGDGKKDVEPVIHEIYDEVVFTDPTTSFCNQLLTETPKIKSQDLSVQESFKPYSDEEDFSKLLQAQKF